MQQAEKRTLFDNLLYYLFEIKLTIKTTLLLQFIFILLFAVSSLAIGVHLFLLTPNVTYVFHNYGETSDCWSKLGKNISCTVSIEVKDKLEPPINVYYQLENFISNSKDYINSKSNAQLFGQDVILGSKQANKCIPYVTNKQMGVIKSWAGVPLDPNALASPCGLQAKLFYKDEIEMKLNETSIPIAPAVSSRQFSRSRSSETTQWVDPTDSSFQIWMTTSVNKTVTKLYGIINQPLEVGVYSFNIKNHMNYTSLETKKSIRLTKINNQFGNNWLLGLLFIGGGTALLLICVLRFIYDMSNLNKRI